MASLSAVAYILDQERLNDSAKEISAIGRSLHDGVRVFAGHLTKLGRNLRLSVEAYNGSVKSLRNLAVTGPLINAANNVSVEYMTDPQATSWTAFPWTFNSGTFDIKAFPNDVTAILARFRVHLHNTDPTQTPLVSSVTLGHALRPRRYMQIEIEILCSDGLVRRDGVPMRIGRRQIQQLVEAAVDEPGSVTCTLPDESVQELSFTDYAISQSFDEIGRQWRGSLSIKAVQWERFKCGD